MSELINIKIAKVPKGTVRSGRTGVAGSSAVLRIESKDAEFAARAGYAHHAGDADHAAKADVAKEAERLSSGAMSRLSDEFLSKKKNDSTPYDLGVRKVTAAQGFEAGNYLAGVSGGMLGIDSTDEQSFADVFKLWVRGKAYFKTLTIMEAATLAGKQYITPGGAVKCTMVEEVKDASGSVTDYRCWFLSEQDGEKTESKIVAGDQAISEMFNARTGTANKVSNHRYWRLVTAVNNDAATDDAGNHYGYIDLSKSDCETGSDVPQAGDVIAHLGNRMDPLRQAAMVFSTVDPDSPCVKLLTGIDHYTLTGKDIISQGYDHVKGHAYMKVYGDVYIGDPDGSTFVKYDQDTKKLDINAALSVGSTIGGQPFEQWLLDHGYTDDTLAQQAIQTIAGYEYLKNTLLPENSTQIAGGLIMSTLISLGYTDSAGRHTMAGMNGSWVSGLGGRTIGSWWGGPMVDLFDANDVRKNLTAGTYATSLVRMDGSAYFADGKVGFKKNGGGWLAGDNIRWDDTGAITFGNGIKIDLGGGDSTTLGGIQNTLGSVLTLVNSLSNVLVPVDAQGNRVAWDSANLYAVKSVKGFYSESFVSGRGLNGNGGGSGGGTTGKSYLSDLLDVQLGTPSNGQALVYRNGKWVNETIATASLTGVALESWVEANYVTLNTAQTISGQKTFSSPVKTANTSGTWLSGREQAAIMYAGGSAITANSAHYLFNMRSASGHVIAFGGLGDMLGFYTYLADQTANSANSVLRCNLATGDWSTNANFQAAGFKKSGGTSSQFLKADGSVDSNSYLTTASASSTYVKKSGDTMTGILKIESGNDGKIVLNNTDSEINYQQIVFQQNGAEYGRLGTGTNGKLSWNGHIMLHQENYPEYLDTRYLRLSGGTMANTNLVANLNADLLDGRHVGNHLGRIPIWTDFPPFNWLMEHGYLQSDYNSIGYPNELYFKALLKWVISNYNGSNLLLMGRAAPSSQGILHLSIYNTAAVKDGLPEHSYAVFHGYAGYVACFGTLSYVWRWNNANYNGSLSGNASSATKLADDTAFTAWGQTFFQTGKPKSVTGNMSGVGDITMNGNLYGVKFLTFIPSVNTSSSAHNVAVQIDGNSLNLSRRTQLNVFEDYILSVNLASSYVGIGTPSPSAKLEVAGLIKASSGIQIGGDADYGWYNISSRIAAGASVARGVNVGSLLVSNAWGDATKVPANGIYSKGAVRIGDCTISWDSTNNMLKFDKGIYSEGAVSARGINANAGGGTGPGATALSALTDVQLGTLSSGQFLKWNGTKWTNATIMMPSLTGYALESWVNANFLPVTALDDDGELGGTFLKADGSNATSSTMSGLTGMLPAFPTAAFADTDMFYVKGASSRMCGMMSIWDYIKDKMSDGGDDTNLGTSANPFGSVYLKDISTDGSATKLTIRCAGSANQLNLYSNGNVGLGNSAQSTYRLDVNGTGRFTGNLSCLKLTQTSDMRMKTVTGDLALTLRSLADAPVFRFSWRNSGESDFGTSAQYWQSVDPALVVVSPEGALGIDYGKIALAGLKTVANMTLDHEQRIAELERENEELRERIAELQTI